MPLASFSTLQWSRTAKLQLAMGSMRLLCALAATAAALVAPPGRTQLAPRATTCRTALPNDVGLEDAFDGALSGLLDVLERASTNGAVADFGAAASAAADTFAAADPVVQAGAAAVALAGGAASVFRPPPKFPVIYGSWFGDKMSADMRSCISAGLRSGLTAMEVRTQALPNLDEAKFGTPTNERFQIECARALGLSSGPTKCRPVWKSARWRGGSTQSTRRCLRNCI